MLVEEGTGMSWVYIISFTAIVVRLIHEQTMSKFVKKEKPLVNLKLNGQQESITLYFPSTETGQYLFYARSKMKENNDEMGLRIGDQINVSFQCDNEPEARGMFEALLEKRVQVTAHKSKQSAIDQKTGSTYYIIKTSNSSTIDDCYVSDSDVTDDDLELRPKKKKNKN